MGGYSLQPHESFVHRLDGVRHGGAWAQFTDELVLTNRNLVLIKKGMWGNEKGIQIFPLAQIKVFQNKAQAIAVDKDGSYTLEVYFQSGTERFGFQYPDRKEVAFWAQKINELITGTPVEPDSPEPEKVGKVAEAMKGTVDAFKYAFGRKPDAPPVVSAPVMVAGDCSSCGAPVSGLNGQAVTCSYCDMATQL